MKYEGLTEVLNVTLWCGCTIAAQGGSRLLDTATYIMLAVWHPVFGLMSCGPPVQHETVRLHAKDPLPATLCMTQAPHLATATEPKCLCIDAPARCPHANLPHCA